MKIYFMKQQAVDYFKTNLGLLYVNYFQRDDNSWMEEAFGEDPFTFFMEIPDFELAALSDERSAGEIDLENCKLVYDNLKTLSESQASDERLWAGLCNNTFYKYLRRRYGYTTAKLKDKEKDAGSIMSRFFYASKAKVFKGDAVNVRSGFYRNALAKCWWVGHGTYDKSNQLNHFEMLDTLGANDLSTKVNDIFYSNTFASNPTILKGISDSFGFFNKSGIKLRMREDIRPALQYLNAVGGVKLLDVLSSDEIKDMMVQRISELLKAGGDDIETEENDENSIYDLDEEVVVDSTDDIYLDSHEEDATEKLKESINTENAEQTKTSRVRPDFVTWGCYIKVHREKDDKITERHLPANENERQLILLERKMLGKQIGHRVYLSGSWYELVEFGLEDNYKD